MRVLVADADATVLDGAQQALQAAGHALLLARDGLQAWNIGREQGFDVAFLAWDLPKLDALQVNSLWQHEEALKGRPVVVTVQAAHMAQARAWAQLTAGHAPTWDVLAKPFAPRLMVDVLEAVTAP